MINYSRRPLKWWLSTPLYASRLTRSHLRTIVSRFHGINAVTRKVKPYLPVKRNGFFVEAGAHDGVIGSNTLFFERFMGWKGLCVEPLPEQAAQCRANRRRSTRVENVALVNADYQSPDITIYPASLMSVVEGALPEEQRRKWVEKGEQAQGLSRAEPFKVPAISLSRLLDDMGAPRIDFFSLDVEGYELRVLEGIDFERHAPRVILVEVRFHRDEIFEMLLPRYNYIPKISPHDALFVLK